MTSDNANVSIIIINYNSSSYTNQCVNSIIEHTKSHQNYEIIIVDNHSKEDDYACIASLQSIPCIKMVRSEINLGFSGGNMLGIQHAHPKATYYFFLNNDCVFLNDVISIMSDFMSGTQSAGIATAQMFSEDMKMQPSFGYFPSVAVKLLGHSFLRMLNYNKYLSPKKEYSAPVAVQRVTGSAMFIRGTYFVRLGGFDTNYFLYCEEEDICMRMHKNGFGVYLVPLAKFIHYGGASTQRNLAIEKEFYISLFYFFRKYYVFPQRIVLKLLYAFKLFRKSYKGSKFAKLAFFVLKGAPMRESLRTTYVLRG